MIGAPVLIVLHNGVLFVENIVCVSRVLPELRVLCTLFLHIYKALFAFSSSKLANYVLRVSKWVLKTKIFTCYCKGRRQSK